MAYLKKLQVLAELCGFVHLWLTSQKNSLYEGKLENNRKVLIALQQTIDNTQNISCENLEHLERVYSEHAALISTYCGDELKYIGIQLMHKKYSKMIPFNGMLMLPDAKRFYEDWLRAAILKADQQVVLSLINHDVNVNVAWAGGITPLMLGSEIEGVSDHIVSMLISAGANVFSKDADGCMAIQRVSCQERAKQKMREAFYEDFFSKSLIESPEKLDEMLVRYPKEANLTPINLMNFVMEKFVQAEAPDDLPALSMTQGNAFSAYFCREKDPSTVIEYWRIRCLLRIKICALSFEGCVEIISDDKSDLICLIDRVFLSLVASLSLNQKKMLYEMRISLESFLAQNDIKFYRDNLFKIDKLFESIDRSLIIFLIDNLRRTDPDVCRRLVKQLLDRYRTAEKDSELVKELEWSVMRESLRVGFFPLVHDLLAVGVPVENEALKQFPLKDAIEAGRVGTVKFLIEQGARWQGRDLLLHAIQHRQLTVVRYFLSIGLDVNARRESTDTYFDHANAVNDFNIMKCVASTHLSLFSWKAAYPKSTESLSSLLGEQAIQITPEMVAQYVSVEQPDLAVPALSLENPLGQFIGQSPEAQAILKARSKAQK